MFIFSFKHYSAMPKIQNQIQTNSIRNSIQNETKMPMKSVSKNVNVCVLNCVMNLIKCAMNHIVLYESYPYSINKSKCTLISILRTVELLS